MQERDKQLQIQLQLRDEYMDAELRKRDQNLEKTLKKRDEEWKCSDPRERPDPIGESKPKPRGRPVNSFYLHFYYVLFFKNVATRIPGPTRMADPNRSPVYSDVFIYLIKTFYYVISLRKRFQFWASP